MKSVKITCYPWPITLLKQNTNKNDITTMASTTTLFQHFQLPGEHLQQCVIPYKSIGYPFLNITLSDFVISNFEFSFSFFFSVLDIADLDMNIALIPSIMTSFALRATKFKIPVRARIWVKNQIETNKLQHRS